MHTVMIFNGLYKIYWPAVYAVCNQYDHNYTAHYLDDYTVLNLSITKDQQEALASDLAYVIRS